MFPGANSNASVLVKPSRSILLTLWTPSSWKRITSVWDGEGVEESICWISHAQQITAEQAQSSDSLCPTLLKNKAIWIQARPRTSGIRQGSMLDAVPGWPRKIHGHPFLCTNQELAKHLPQVEYKLRWERPR